MKLIKNILLFFGAVTVAFILFSFYDNSGHTGYVDNRILFEKFLGKKELEVRLNKLANNQKAQLDSLRLNLLATRNQYAATKNKELQELLGNQEFRFRQLEQEFTSYYEEESQKYTQDVWVQINQYVLEFGKEKDYDFIYGASGDGGLMYANDEYNLTDEVLNYINLRYEGH